jgi:hypothetical protein
MLKFDQRFSYVRPWPTSSCWAIFPSTICSPLLIPPVMMAEQRYRAEQDKRF